MTLAFYDEQCEICQAFVSWLRVLDRRGQVECLPLDPVRLAAEGLDPEACARELHIVTARGQVLAGWDAVAHLARLFPLTWAIGSVGSLPGFRRLGRAAYGWVARNRYALSKCRGGACAVNRRPAPLGALRGCHWTGMLVRLPLTVAALAAQVARNLSRYLRTWGRRFELLDGRLTILVLNGWPCDLISMLFGEHFITVLYDGIAIDPGPVKLRRALLAHLRRLPGAAIRYVVATHQHEEHAGNLNWLAGQAGARIAVGGTTARCLQPPARLPGIRRFMIGQAPPLEPPFELLGDRLDGLLVFPAPGHSEDHIVLYDPRERILFAGDSFMGTYFSAPNPDVDSRHWIETLERLLALPIDVLVEGHGHIHTLRPDIPDTCPLVVRRDPRQELLEKLRFCQWLREQVAAGLAEGLPLGAVRLSCFPWGRRFAWENFWNDALARLFSRGHWSRTELIRSFVRDRGDVFPRVYEARVEPPKR